MVVKEKFWFGGRLGWGSCLGAGGNSYEGRRETGAEDTALSVSGLRRSHWESGTLLSGPRGHFEKFHLTLTLTRASPWVSRQDFELGRPTGFGVTAD